MNFFFFSIGTNTAQSCRKICEEYGVDAVKRRVRQKMFIMFLNRHDFDNEVTFFYIFFCHFFIKGNSNVTRMLAKHCRLTWSMHNLKKWNNKWIIFTKKYIKTRGGKTSYYSISVLKFHTYL